MPPTFSQPSNLGEKPGPHVTELFVSAELESFTEEGAQGGGARDEERRGGGDRRASAGSDIIPGSPMTARPPPLDSTPARPPSGAAKSQRTQRVSVAGKFGAGGSFSRSPSSSHAFRIAGSEHHGHTKAI